MVNHCALSDTNSQNDVCIDEVSEKYAQCQQSFTKFNNVNV